MNEQLVWVLLETGIVLVAVLGRVAHSALLTQAKLGRASRKAPRVRIADAKEGAVVKLVGRVRAVGQPLRSPLGGRACVFFETAIYGRYERYNEEGSAYPSWEEIGRETKSIDLLLEDETGHAFVRAAGWLVAPSIEHVVKDFEPHDDIPPELERVRYSNRVSAGRSRASGRPARVGAGAGPDVLSAVAGNRRQMPKKGRGPPAVACVARDGGLCAATPAFLTQSRSLELVEKNLRARCLDIINASRQPCQWGPRTGGSRREKGRPSGIAAYTPRATPTRSTYPIRAGRCRMPLNKPWDNQAWGRGGAKLVLIAIGLAPTACAEHPRVGWPKPPSATCWQDPPLLHGRGREGEALALARRELDRAETASPLVGAQILEALPQLIPDFDGYVGVPNCRLAFVERMSEATFVGARVRYSRLLLARVRAVGRVEDYVDSRERAPRASFLLKLAELPDDRMTPYQFAPGESGPPPPKSLVRDLALSYLADSWQFSNIPQTKQFLLRRMRVSTDDKELLLLGGRGGHLLAGFAADPKEGSALWRAWVSDARRRLWGPPDPVSLSIVFSRLAPVGSYGEPSGASARALAEEVLRARGRFPLTAGAGDAARDLEALMRSALYELDASDKRLYFTYLSFPPYAFDPWRDWLEKEPTSARPAESDVSARVAELDGELARATFFLPSKRYVLAELGRWVGSGDADRRLDEWAASLFDHAGRVRLSQESLGRIALSLNLERADAGRRRELLLRLLRARPDEIAEYDGRDDEHCGGCVYVQDKESVRQVAARALAARLDWVERDEALRAWLSERASSRDDAAGGHYDSETTRILQPAYERLLDFYGSSSSQTDRERGREILRSWIEGLPSFLRLKNTNLYKIEVARDRIYALEKFARGYGLVAESRRPLDAILGRGPEPLPPGARFAPENHQIVRAATVVSYQLDAR